MTIDREKSTTAGARLDEMTYGACEGCGSTEPVWSLKARGETTCCPNRKMVSAEAWRIRALASMEIAVIAGRERDTFRLLADQFGAALEALIPTIDILESRFGAALAEREAGK